MISAVTLSSKNQITLPKFILNILGIKSGEKLLVETDANVIKIKPVRRSIVDEIAGSISVDSSKRGISYKKALDATMDEVVKDLTRK